MLRAPTCDRGGPLGQGRLSRARPADWGAAMTENKGIIIGIVTGVVAILAIGIFLFYAKPKPTPIDTATITATEQRLVAISAGNFSALAVMNDKGEGADLRPYDGKKLLINLWATWCAPCVKELPSLGKLQ